MDEEAKAYGETMNGGRLSAVEKGKQKVADADLRPPAPLVLESAAGGEPRRAAAGDAAANWNAAAAGSSFPRHLLLRTPRSTSEIEELPPSPPPAGTPRPRLPALSLSAAGAAAGLAAVAGLEGVMNNALQAALGSRLRELEEAAKRRREGADKPEPELLQHQLGTFEVMKDMMLALRLQDEEMQPVEESWKPAVPDVPHKPQRNNNKRKAEEMEALEEFSDDDSEAEEMQTSEEFSDDSWLGKHQ